jgi:hypothetical protein
MQAKKAKNKIKLSEKNLQIYLCVVVEKDLESQNKSKIKTFKLFYMLIVQYFLRFLIKPYS